MKPKEKETDNPKAKLVTVVLTPRWKQPLAGIISFIWIFLVTFLVWYLIDLSQFAGAFSLFGSFGILATLFSIWFDTWPFSKLRSPWKVGLAATILNIIVVLIFYFVATWFAGVYASSIGLANPAATNMVGWSVFGALSASCFSFAILWTGSSQYWPVLNKTQPVRGIFVFIEGWIITLIAWFLLFFYTGNPAADPLVPSTWTLQSFSTNMAWSQWTIFLTLLTLLTFEYWPWKRVGKQPWIGAFAYIMVLILSFIISSTFFIVAQGVLLPAILASGYTITPGMEPLAAGVMTSVFADCFIAGVLVVSKFLDNWPKQFSQAANYFARLIVVVLFGILIFFVYYLISPFLLGRPTDASLNDPTPFILLFLWIELVFAYLWKRWPVYRTVE